MMILGAKRIPVAFKISIIMLVRSRTKICDSGVSAVGAQASTRERQDVNRQTVRTSTSGLPQRIFNPYRTNVENRVSS